MKVPVGVLPQMEAVALGVSRKRIDVVAKVEAAWWVIEVKPYASQTALGQAVSYVRLFAQEYGVAGPVVPVVVCCAADEDLREDFRRLGVRIEEVGYGA
jgi:hypothetical protein